MEHIKKAISIVGWPAKLAKELKEKGHRCTPQLVRSWTLEKGHKQHRPVPPNMAIGIEKLTNGQVLAEQLCPDFDWVNARAAKQEI